jgi:hypothetical protein
VELKTNITAEHLEKAFNFALKYHLSSTKMKRDRTTGRHRRLGGISDDFISGKVIELGVLDILKKINKEKKYLPDLGVRDEQDFTEPDIIKIKDSEKPSGRPPKAFIEIKHVSDRDSWVGLTAEQYESMLSNPIVDNCPEKLFVVYASIIPKKPMKKEYSDLLGTYLKTKNIDKNLDVFADPTDLDVKIQFVITGKELITKGKKFNKADRKLNIPADYMFETEMIQKRNRDVFNKDGRLGKNIVEENCLNKNIPTQTLDKFPSQPGDFTFNGKLQVFRKTNSNSILYVKCKSPVTIYNSFMGQYVLKKGTHTFNVKITQECNRNNIFVPKRNIDNVMTRTLIERMQEIATNI